MPEVIDIIGLPVVQRNLDRLSGKQLEKALQEGAFAIGKELENELKFYPPPKPAAASAAFTFQSQRQRRWMMWALNTGQIEIPYRRTGNLARAWSTRKQTGGAVVSNPQSYAAFVQGSESQTAMHKAIGWRTDKDAVGAVQKGDVIERIMLQAIEKELEES